MPTYEYACTNCGNRFDIFQRFADAPLTICDVCGGVLRKVFHPAGIVLKGSGFYRNDSRKAGVGAGSSDGSRGSETSGSGNGSGSAPSKETSKEASSGSGTGTGSRGSSSSGSGSGSGSGKKTASDASSGS